MAVLNPITAVLKEAKILHSNSRSGIGEILDQKGVSLDDAAESLRELINSGEDSIRLRATETAFKLHGVMKEAETPTVPQITFLIKGDNTNLSMILTPRE